MKHYLKRLEDAVKANWDRQALCNYRGEQFTFAEMAGHIARLHILFENAGLKKGMKVALCAKNSARWGIAFFAVNTYEAVVVPILADFHPDSINTLVDHSESLVLFTDADMWKKLDRSKMPNIKAVMAVGDFSLLYAANDNIAAAAAGLDDLFAARYPDGFTPDKVSYPDGNDKELAIINYTSGTTSAPKGVMLRYECLSANVEFGQNWLPSYPEDKIVSMLPMAHMYGMMFELIYPLCGGSSVYYLGKTPTPALLLGAMAEVRPYLVITVPLVMEKIFKSKVQPVLNKPVMKVLTSIPGINRIIFNKIRKTLIDAFGGKVRSIIMGGAALNPDVEKWFRKFRLPFTVGYGMTEAAPLLAYAPWQSFEPRSCGRAVDSAEVRIDSEDPQNVAGEIQARGISIMSGYFKNEEASRAAFTDDGWMNTGDLGVIDADGNIFIRGRSKNMILSANGQNIYPEEIEAVVNSRPYVVESVVLDRGAKLVALVYFDTEKAKADGIDLAAYAGSIVGDVNKSMPSYSKLAKVEIMDQPFEKTPKMSIKRFMYK
ncbi:AMP-binding protein [uncultured Bacteroides sp.]|uniref:AMP-binding protein n=1 Tax=uncultured Bacteroides sp. TaxID=162156 RepID=UPI0026111A9E|nr:AMP-binding protein [uncultured Bacteroides sp.]